MVSLSERALGRVAAKDVKNPLTGEIIIKKDEMIDEAGCEKIDAAGVKSIKCLFSNDMWFKRRCMCNMLWKRFIKRKNGSCW